MKKRTGILMFLICSLLIATLSGCGNSQNSDNTTPSTPPPSNENTQNKPTDENKQIMDKYMSIIKDNKSESEVLAYIDQNISKVSKSDADTMIKELGNLYKKNLPELTKKYDKANENPALFDAYPTDMDEKNADNITDSELKSLVKDTYKNGYSLSKSEGQIYPEVNVKSLEKYSAYTTSKNISELLNLPR